MKTIWKYPFPVTDEFTLKLPPDAVVLSVQVQHGIPCLWALVTPSSAVRHERRFYVCGTGQPCDRSSVEFRGTFQLDDERLVFHLFEES